MTRSAAATPCATSSSRCTPASSRPRPKLRNITFADGVAGLEAVFVGRHVAEFGGVPATGAEVRMPYAVFYDIDGDKITALRAYFPIAALVGRLQEANAARV